MKKLFVLFVLLFSVSFTYTVVAQQSLPRKGHLISIPEKIQKFVLDPLPAGDYTVGIGGDFTTIDSAFNKLSVDGIAGNVALWLTDSIYTAPATEFGFLLNGPIPGVGSTSRVTIKPAANKNVIIEGNRNSQLTFLNVSYVTIDGVNLTGNQTLTIHSIYNGQYSFNDCIDFLDNSDHNVVQSVTFIAEDNTRLSCGPGFWNLSGTNVSADSNLIQYNFIKKAGLGIFVSSWNGNVVSRATSNIIKGNRIGSETDSLISFGIDVEHAQNTIIENNTIQNLTVSAPHISGQRTAMGIESYWGNGDIIRNNVVHKIRDSYSSGVGGFGIYLGGDAGNIGNNNLVYNNMVYDIEGTSISNSSSVTGIHLYSQSNPKIYYNSVYLSGIGTNHQGSAAFYINEGCTNVEAKNNIFVNTRDESPYCASSVYSYNYAVLTSDNNDLYYIQNPNNCLVRIGSINYLTLSDWQTTERDSNSISEMPNFNNPDLHLSSLIPTGIESHAAPLAGIDTDFDGDLRNTTTPDIGADEFDGIVGVEDEITLLTEFSLEQNYPNPFNPSTTLRYSIPHESKVIIKVYDIVGNEIETLVNEEKTIGTYEVEFNSSKLSSGIYFYQMKAENYTQTKKMVLLR